MKAMWRGDLGQQMSIDLKDLVGNVVDDGF